MCPKPCVLLLPGGPSPQLLGLHHEKALHDATDVAQVECVVALGGRGEKGGDDLLVDVDGALHNTVTELLGSVKTV